LPKFPITGENVILIFLSDETGMIPESLSDQFFAILKTYFPLDRPWQNIIPFPIGYSNSADLIHPVPFAERQIDVSFAGNFLPNRLDFYRQFSGLRFLPPFSLRSNILKKAYWHLLRRFCALGEFTGWLPRTRCYFSNGFAKGLSRAEYADVLSNTKIALCPRGFISTECWRLFDAMKAGCIIVADELPPSPWFLDSPIIVEKNWLQIKSRLTALLQSPDEMAEIQTRTVDWWNRVCSDEASAQYVAAEIAKRIIP
jgi:hypothetical protein